MQERLKAVDGLRGVAILMVTLHHLGMLWRSRLGPVAPFLSFGRHGVDLFFAISGFCLYYQVARAWRQGKSAIPWGQFAARRATRILPAYLVALVAWLFIWHSHAPWPLSVGTWQGWQKNLLTHLTFTHTLSRDTFYSVHPVFWSLGTEVHFYLLFPLLAAACWRRPGWFLGGAFGVSAVVFWVSGGPIPDSLKLPPGFCLQRSVFGCLSEFGAGMVAAHVLVKRQGKPLHPASLAVLWVMGAVGVLLGSVWEWWGDRFLLTVAPSWGALLLASTGTQRRNPALLVPVVWLGVVSYSVYLHNYLFFFLPRDLPLWLWFALAASVVLAIGSVSYYAVERPALAWRARHRLTSTTLSPPPSIAGQRAA